MTPFVEECRREWKRLGVPDLLAEEMASELESDLAEAEADGVSAAEMTGESDPRRFAAAWAGERGLVSAPAPQQRRRRIWPWVVALVLLILLAAWLALQSVGSSHATGPARSSTPGPPTTVPRLVGQEICTAVRMAHKAGLAPRHTVYEGRCDARVVYQRPAAGRRVPRHTATTLLLSLPGRVPPLIGAHECSAQKIALRHGFHIRRLPATSRCNAVVVRQSPAAGQVARPGAAVTVRVREAKS
jgi:hypothetical protein